MATCQSIITTAFRRLRVLDEREEPTTEHGIVGLDALQGLFDHYISTAQLTDYVATANYTAKENERIRLSGGSWTITAPTTISDDGDRDPYDLSAIVVAGATPVHKIYDAQLGTWVTVSGLTLAGECPLSTRNRAAMTGVLAKQLSGEYGRSLSRENDSELLADAARGRQLLTRIGGERPRVVPTYY